MKPLTTPLKPKHVRMAERAAPLLPQMDRLQAEIARLREIVAHQTLMLEDMAKAANRCCLTGLLNRRGLAAALDGALADFDRYDHAGAVVLIDLNAFKPINDTYGHAAGDAVLRHVAALLRDHVRASDTVARLGGDEFVLILKETDAATAVAQARRLAALLRATPCAYGGVTLPVSASMGVASFDEAGEAEALLALADGRMYAVKKGSKLARA